MSDLLLGIAASFISAVLWGTNFVPMKFSRSEPVMFHAFMTIGILVSSVAYLLATGTTFSINVFAIAAGILWGAGNLLAVRALESSGLSRALPTWAGTVVVLTFIWGLVIFQETPGSLPPALLGIILFLVGIPLVSSRQEKSKNQKGIAIALVAGIMFSFYLVPFKVFNIAYGEWLFSSALGILLTGIPILVMNHTKLGEYAYGVLGGVMWNAASLSSLYAVSYLGFAIGVPLTQLALVISALWGVFYFKEVKGKLVYKVMLGVLLLFIAGFLLSFSKA